MSAANADEAVLAEQELLLLAHSLQVGSLLGESPLELLEPLLTLDLLAHVLGHDHESELALALHVLHDLAKAAELVHANAVDGEQHVAVVEAGAFGGRARLHVAHEANVLGLLGVRVEEAVALQVEAELAVIV